MKFSIENRFQYYRIPGQKPTDKVRKTTEHKILVSLSILAFLSVALLIINLMIAPLGQSTVIIGKVMLPAAFAGGIVLSAWSLYMGITRRKQIEVVAVSYLLFTIFMLYALLRMLF